MRSRPDKITKLEIGTQNYQIDEAGYLIDPDQWDEAFANHVATEQKLALDKVHWQLLAFMRAYLDDHSIAADARFTIRELAKLQNISKKSAQVLLFKLFPYGYVRQACKISGMRQPRAWSTG